MVYEFISAFQINKMPEDVSSIILLLQTKTAVASDGIPLNSPHPPKAQNISLDEDRHFSFNNCTNIHITIQK